MWRPEGCVPECVTCRSTSVRCFIRTGIVAASNGQMAFQRRNGRFLQLARLMSPAAAGSQERHCARTLALQLRAGSGMGWTERAKDSMTRFPEHENLPPANLDQSVA
jgi:hypothetical protein